MSFQDIPSDASAALIRRRQRQFVNELMETMRVEIVDQINQGKVPEDWDGIDLRALIEHHATQAAYSIHEKYNRRRLRDFRNAVIVNNL